MQDLGISIFLFSLIVPRYRHINDGSFLILHIDEHNIRASSLYNTVGSGVEIPLHFRVRALNRLICSRFMPVFGRFKTILAVHLLVNNSGDLIIELFIPGLSQL